MLITTLVLQSRQQPQQVPKKCCHDTLLFVIWLIVSLVLALFFYGTEAAFLSCDKYKFAINNKKKGYINYLYNNLFGHPRQFLATSTVGKTMAFVLFVASSLVLLQEMSDGGTLSFSRLLLFVISLLLILLLTNHLLPRLLFQRNANFWMRFSWCQLSCFVLFYPLTRFSSSYPSSLGSFWCQF